MPIYEYQCRTCEFVFEKFKKTSAEADQPETCPACGDGECERQVSAFSSLAGFGDPRGAGRCGPSSGFS